MMKSKVCCIAMTALLSASCSNNNDSSSVANPIPSLVAIAQSTLPATLESSAVALHAGPIRTMDLNLDELKSRIFSPGPTDFLYRLNAVDSRLAELASRVSSCADLTTQTYTPPAVVTGLTFPMEFSCKETIDASAMGMASYDLYFGKKDGFWYLAEIQVNSGFSSGDAEPPTMAVLAKVSEDGINMDVWQISVEHNGSTDYAGVMHITADKTAGVFSLTTASDADATQTISPGANYSGLGCGVEMITDGLEVYANGQFSQLASCPTAATVCMESNLTTSSASNCTSLSSSSSLLPLLQRADVSGANAKSLIVDGTGLPTL